MYRCVAHNNLLSHPWGSTSKFNKRGSNITASWFIVNYGSGQRTYLLSTMKINNNNYRRHINGYILKPINQLNNNLNNI